MRHELDRSASWRNHFMTHGVVRRPETSAERKKWEAALQAEAQRLSRSLRRAAMGAGLLLLLTLAGAGLAMGHGSVLWGVGGVFLSLAALVGVLHRHDTLKMRAATVRGQLLDLRTPLTTVQMAHLQLLRQDLAQCDDYLRMLAASGRPPVNLDYARCLQLGELSRRYQRVARRRHLAEQFGTAQGPVRERTRRPAPRVPGPLINEGGAV